MEWTPAAEKVILVCRDKKIVSRVRGEWRGGRGTLRARRAGR